MDYSRAGSWFNAIDFLQPITIIGAGATGSKIFEALTCLGLRDITIYDFDKVEEHNLANQTFVTPDIGKTKTKALADWFAFKTGETKPKNMHFNDTKVIGNMRNDIKGIVFLLTDTMESRKEIFKNSLQFNPHVPLVIETRMAISHGNIFLFNPNNVLQARQWHDTLIEDDDAEVSACGTTLSVGTTASIIANLAVNQLIQYHKHPDCLDECINVFLQPLTVSASSWPKNTNAAA